jgi:hypothetical protein
MIEIDLLEKKKPVRLPTVAGIDLNEVSLRPLILAYIVKICVDSFILPGIGSNIEDLQLKSTSLAKRQRKLQAEQKKNRNIKDLLSAFDKQIAKLKLRETQVEKVLKQKSNPKNILAALSKIVPEDLWFNNLKIDKSKKLFLDGGAVSYRSVGELISKSNELEFFNGAIIIKDSTTEEKKHFGQTYRLQKFTIEGAIQSFGVFEQ